MRTNADEFVEDARHLNPSALLTHALTHRDDVAIAGDGVGVAQHRPGRIVGTQSAALQTARRTDLGEDDDAREARVRIAVHFRRDHEDAHRARRRLDIVVRLRREHLGELRARHPRQTPSQPAK